MLKNVLDVSLKNEVKNKINPNKNNPNKKNFKNKFKLGYIILIVFSIIFSIRVLGVINKYGERGGYAYIQLLNFALPLVEVQSFDENVYSENEISLERVVYEALGLNNISTFNIVGSEVSFFKSITNNYGGIKPKNDIGSFLKPYELKEDSVKKLTPEEIAELNKTSAAYDPSLKKPLDNSKPEVLIYHSHNTEGYGINHTEDKNANVIGIGEIIKEELEKNYGISVIHDKTNHIADYNLSYVRSGETVQKYLNEYGDFKLIVDLHRDSASKELSTANLNNQSLSRLMFVTAQNSPRYDKNKELAEYFANKAQELFPGILRGIPIYEYDIAQQNGFNCGMSDNMILIENGSDTNTPQEARLTGKYIARLIAEYINEKS